jgi:DNA-binding transcriptional LysR family regulator
MELRHLRYFVAVAEELHFGRAARRLHITQPPLSQQIQLLERELGVKLFVRGRKIQLTEAGRVFLEEGRRTIEVADRAARAARAAGAGEAARLRIGYPAATMFELVPAALRTFAKRCPDVGVEAVAGHAGELLSALRDDQLDVAFLTMRAHDSEAICFRLLHREPLLLAMPEDHRLVDRGPVAMEEVVKEPMILLPRALDPIVHEYLVDLVVADTPTAPLMVHEAITLESAYSAVAAKLGVAVVAESTARIMAVHGVAHRPFAPPQPVLELSVAWPHRRTSTAVRSFLFIVAELTAALDVADDSRSPPLLPNDDFDR